MRLKNWVRMGLVYAGILIAAVILLDVFMTFSVVEEGTSREIPLYSPIQILIYGGVIAAAMVLGAYRAEIPLAVSFGCTRKEAFAGIQLVRVIPTSAIVLLALAAAVFGRVDTPSDAIASYSFGFGCMLVLQAIGIWMGSLSVKKGKIFVMVTAALIGFFSGIAVAVGTVIEEWQVPVVLAVIAPLLGAALYALMLRFEWKRLRIMQVKL